MAAGGSILFSSEKRQSTQTSDSPFVSAIHDSSSHNASGYLTTPESSSCLSEMQEVFLNSSERLCHRLKSFTYQSGTTEDVSELRLPTPEVTRAIPFTSPPSEELPFSLCPRLVPSMSMEELSTPLEHQTLFTPSSSMYVKRNKCQTNEMNSSGPSIHPTDFSTPLGKGLKRARCHSESDSTVNRFCCVQSPIVPELQERHQLKWRDSVKSNLLKHYPSVSPQLDTQPIAPVRFSTPKDVCNLTVQDGQSELLCRSDVSYKTPSFLKNSSSASTESFLSVLSGFSGSYSSCTYNKNGSVNFNSVRSKPSTSTPACSSFTYSGCRRTPKVFIDGREHVDFIRYLGEVSDHHGVVSKILGHLSPQDLCSFSSVSNVWHRVMLKDPSAKRRWKIFKDQLEKNKENVKKDCKYKKPLGELEHDISAQLQRSALFEINNHSTPGSNTSQRVVADGSQENSNLSSNSLRFQLFVKEGRKLRPGECLQSCPRCSSPSQVVSQEGQGRCTRSVCGFEFCTRCLCESSVRHVCRTPQSSRLSQSLSSVGSKKSKRNLRRL